MTGNNSSGAGPGNAGTTSNNLKKSIGKIIHGINSDILEYVEEKKKVKTGGTLSKKGEAKEDAVKKKKEALEDSLKGLEDRPEYVEQEKMEKLVKMIKDNILTAEKALNSDDANDDELQSEIAGAQKSAADAIEEVDRLERQTENEMQAMAQNLARVTVNQIVTDSQEDSIQIVDNDDEELNREFNAIGKYQRSSRKYD